MQSRLTPLRFAEHICHAPARQNLCACKIGFADAQRLHNGFT